LLAFIAPDSDIDKFDNLKEAIVVIIEMIEKCAKKIDSESQPDRVKVDITEGADNVYETVRLQVKNTIWNLIELLLALTHMAVNDSIKYDIYYTFKMRDHIRTIINKGSDGEREYALVLLNQLCFDERIAKDILYNSILLAKITELSADKSHTQKASKGILWLINKDKETSPKNLDKKKEKNEAHVMISYNTKSRETCLQVKKFLEAQGHRVWIDVENIGGSSLEAMANAVENCKAFLMCMTEKYKQSSNCRAEAEYAFQCGKPIIPLVMQKGYKADGWLGIILGSKIFIDFQKYELSECLRRLTKEINLYCTDQKW
jgi:hypothetical protein